MYFLSMKNCNYQKCNYLNYVESQNVKFFTKEWLCIKCWNKIFPFTRLNNQKLFSLFYFCNTDSNENCFVLLPPLPHRPSSKKIKMLHLFNEFNYFMTNPNNNSENFNCKYYDISQIKILKICNNNKSLSLFTIKHTLFQRNLMIFNSLSNQQILILMPMLLHNQESIKTYHQQLL